MKIKKFNIRIGNIELRKYNGLEKTITGKDTSDIYEFVQWITDDSNKEFCIVIAFADKTTDGYNIRSVGMRPWELDEQDFKDYNDLVGIFFHIDLLK